MEPIVLLRPGRASANKAEDLIRLANKSNCQIAELLRNLRQSRKEAETEENPMPVAKHRPQVPCASQVAERERSPELEH